VEEEAKRLVESALAVAKDTVLANKRAHDGLSAQLEERERLDGPELAQWLGQVTAPNSLRQFVLQGVLPPAVARR
jgi:ATP-dependent Zn protease